MVFNHSVKVPTQYKKAAQIFKKSINEKKSVKTLIFEEKHARIPNLIGLLKKYSQNKSSIENALEELKILEENPRLDPCMCRVLITELIFGAKKLNGESKPVQTVLSYREKLENAFAKFDTETIQSESIKPRYVRVNTNSFSVIDALEYLKSENWRQRDYQTNNYDDYIKAIRELEEDQFLIDIHVPQLFVFTQKWKSYWAHHDLVKEKKFILQDRATCLVGKLLDPPKNSIVLDMCAAPGMKTLHISNIMENQGTIYAIEQNHERFNVLCQMIKDGNAKQSVRMIKADAIQLKAEDYPGIEYILVDPSCSGSGMQNRLSLEKDEETKNEERLWKLAGLQIKILRHAMTEFPDVKRIAYSTCSIYEEENEQVVQKCLEKCPHFKLLNAKKSLGRIWKNTGNKNYKGIGKNCLYSLPQDDLTDGIFVAIFERIKVTDDTMN